MTEPMKISEAIKQLETLHRKHGDVSIFITGSRDDSEIDEIFYMETPNPRWTGVFIAPCEYTQ